MKWLIVVESNLSHQFAMRTHVLELSRALTNFVDITLVSYAPGFGYFPDVSKNCIYFKAINFRPTNLAQIMNSLRFYFWINNYLDHHNIDVIYQRATSYSLGALLAGKRYQIPTLLEINGAWSDEQNLSRKIISSWKKWMTIPILWLRGKSIDYACRLAGKIVVVTPQLVNYLTSKGIDQSKISPVSNGVNPDHFFPMDKLLMRQEICLDQTSIIIGYIGSLSPWQGLDLLLHGFARLCQERSDLQLMIVGDGIEKNAIHKLIKDLSIENRVLSMGARPYNEIPAYIACCDLMVAPKRPLVSGYSTLKVFEYMSCARPVLASRVQGLEIVERAQAGLLFTPEDVDDLISKLRQLISLSPAQRDEMGQNGRTMVVDQYTWINTARQIIDLVEK